MINYDIWAAPGYWTTLNNAAYYGEPSVEIGKLSPRTVKDLYTDGGVDDTIQLDYGTPYDVTAAVWGVGKQFALATKCSFQIGGNATNAIYEANEVHPDGSGPLMMFSVRGFGSEDDVIATPWRRYNEVNNTNFMPGIVTQPLVEIPPNRWCIAPRIIFINNPTSTGAAPSRSNPRWLGEVLTFLQSNPTYVPCQISLSVFYHGETAGPRSLCTYNFGYNSDTTMLIDTISDLQLTPKMVTYAKATDSPDSSATPPAKILPADFQGDMIRQAPYTRYSGRFFSRFDTVDRIVNIRNYQVTTTLSSLRPGMELGYYWAPSASTFRSGIQMFGKASSEVLEFDDVSYHWATRCCYIDGGVTRDIVQAEPVSSWTGTVRVFSYIVIDDLKTSETTAEAYYRAICHECASAGFYFADSESIAQNATLGGANTDPGLYYPEKIAGITTGNYWKGTDIANAPDADTSSNFDYDYNPGYDPNPGEDDIGDFHTRINSGAISAGTIYYAVSDTEFKDLIRYLNTTYNPDEQELAEDFKGVNPFDYITSAKYYPFPLPYAVAQAINVGPLATGVTGYIMPYTYGNSAYSYFEFGSYTFTPTFNNFLDYSATQIQLYLPWCGVVNLDPAVWIAPPGRTPITLRIRYSFDYVTGSVTAFIFRDGGRGEFLIDSADGTAGIDVPLSLFATGSYQQQIAQAQIAYKQAATSRFTSWMGVLGGLGAAAISGVLGNPLGVVGGLGATGTSLLKLHQSELSADAVSYTLDHTQPQLGAVSAASPFNAAIPDQRPFIIISRPRMQSTLPTGWEVSYARTVGYACTIPTSLSNPQVRGFTVIQSPRLEGIKKSVGTPPKTYTPTEQELGLIRQHMAAGIIL